MRPRTANVRAAGFSAVTWLRSLRAALGLLLTLGAALVIGRAANSVYPLSDWLFWRYAELWLWLSLFSVACVSFGQLLLVRVLRLALPALESAVFSMVLGVVSFVMAMYVAGAVGLFRPWFAVALPFLLWAPGFASGARLWKRLWQAQNTQQSGGLATAAATIFGACCLGIIYLRILTPDALGYDSVWFYSKVAQDYARWGHIGPFPADYSCELPHLASLLYTWGYLLPGLHLTLRWVFALHMEMCLLLWTLAGIAATVARQVERPVPRSTWAVFFLFPGTFVFGLWGTGDHVTAFFSIGVALALLRAVSTPTRATFALLAVPIAGGILTKYQAIYLDIPTLALALLAWAVALGRGRLASLSGNERRDLLWAPAVLAGTCSLLLAPHLIQTSLFHHNPVYPLLQRFFVHSQPTVPNGALLFDYGLRPSQYVPHGTLLEKFEWALRVISTPSLQPRSLLTAACSPFVLLLPAVLFLPFSPRRGATALLALLGVCALSLWAMILFDLRHIETFAPVLVAVTAALIVRLWRLGLVVRLGLVTLVTVQLAWGIDAAFWDSSRPGIDASLRLIQAGLEGKGKTALDQYRRDYVALGEAVPVDAKLVIHTFGVALGINRDILMDSPGFQGLIDYSALRTPRELYDRFRALEVTHLVHEPNGVYASPTRQEDVLFHGLAAQYGVRIGAFGGLFLTAMPKQPPPVEAPYHVLCAGQSDLADGLYPIRELRNVPALPQEEQVVAKPEQRASEGDWAVLLERADAVLCPTKGCRFDPGASDVLERRFEPILNRIQPWLLYEKRLPPAT